MQQCIALNKAQSMTGLLAVAIAAPKLSSAAWTEASAIRVEAFVGKMRLCSTNSGGTRACVVSIEHTGRGPNQPPLPLMSPAHSRNHCYSHRHTRTAQDSPCVFVLVIALSGLIKTHVPGAPGPPSELVTCLAENRRIRGFMRRHFLVRPPSQL